MIDKWVYIVSWTLVSISFNDCPQGDITEDEFGRKERTVNCYDSYVRTKRTFYDRGFKNREKAWKFYIKGLEEKESLVPSELNSKDYLIFVELDSTRNKKRKYRPR